MSALLVRQEWESRFFKRDIYQLFPEFGTQQELTKQLSHVTGLIQAKIPSHQREQSDKLQKLGFQFVEHAVTFCWRKPHQATLKSLEQANINDLPYLEEIVKYAFPHSRFRPPYFSWHENQRFYRQWIRNAVHSNFDHLCVVHRDTQGIPNGVISLRFLDINTACVGLLAVHPNYYRQGIATQLLNQVAHYTFSQGIHILQVTTQSTNYHAIQCYSNLGATFQQQESWFYLMK